jgi:hypothetical protein
VIGRDRRDELRRAEDLWPAVERELGGAINDAMMAADEVWVWVGVDALEEKFRRGESEHGRNWLDMSERDLRDEIKAELLDLVLYHAMLRARWPRVTYTTDRDLGDEAE